MEELTKEMWKHSNNAFTMVCNIEELNKVIEEYKTLLNRQLLLNELDCKNSNAEGFRSLSIEFHGVSDNYLGGKSIKLIEGEDITEGLLEYLNDKNNLRLNELRQMIEDAVLKGKF